MKAVPKELVQEVIQDPVSIAMMLTNAQIEQVIAEFVSVLNKRNHRRGGQN